MTLDEMKELQRLLEKAQAHAEQQAAYTPNTLTAIEWHGLERECCTVLASLHWAVAMTSEALHYEEN